jgi:hypothetical protein
MTQASPASRAHPSGDPDEVNRRISAYRAALDKRDAALQCLEGLKRALQRVLGRVKSEFKETKAELASMQRQLESEKAEHEAKLAAVQQELNASRRSQMNSLAILPSITPVILDVFEQYISVLDGEASLPDIKAGLIGEIDGLTLPDIGETDGVDLDEMIESQWLSFDELKDGLKRCVSEGFESWSEFRSNVQACLEAWVLQVAAHESGY